LEHSYLTFLMLLSFLLYLDWLQDGESESVVSNSHTVVDYSGGASTNVAAVHDGYVLQKAIVKSAIGGDVLTECLLKTLESKGISVCLLPSTLSDLDSVACYFNRYV
jgi:actin-related protein